ncbi:MAG: hypothetical protein P8P36_01135 [Akkermansiaceae bacterium]|nr:hypothetical protein [Akkermansiaceae bacterium]
MDLSKSLLLPLAVIFLLGACYPYPSNYGKRDAKPTRLQVEQTITSEEQRRIEENRQLLEQQAANGGFNGAGNQAAEGGQWTEPNAANSAPVAATKSKYPTAAAVPGKPGFVFNPYTHNIVDVKGIGSGRLCRDPEDPDPNHKFRVP